MGVRLIVEVLDFAPASLTPRERWTLIVLAESARDATRVCWPGIEDDETFIRRCRLSRSQRYAVLKALIEKGALENVRRGQKHVRASYRIAVMAPAGAVLPDPQDAPEEKGEVPSQRPGLQDAETSAPDSQGPVLQDAENEGVDAQGPGSAFSGSRFSDLSVPVYRTPSPQSPQPPSKEEADASGAPHPKAPIQEAVFEDADATKREEEKALNRRIHRLGRHYCDLNKAADWHKTTGAIRKAIKAEVGTDAEIEAALTEVAGDAQFLLSADVIRVQIQRAKKGRHLHAVPSPQSLSGARGQVVTAEQIRNNEVEFRL